MAWRPEQLEWLRQHIQETGCSLKEAKLAAAAANPEWVAEWEADRKARASAIAETEEALSRGRQLERAVRSAVAAAARDHPELADQFARHKRAIEMAVAERRFVDAMGLAGNEERHALLWEWWSAGLLDRADLRQVITGAWNHGPRSHMAALGPRRWLRLWKASGFVSDDPARPQPLQPIAIWRGAPAFTRGVGHVMVG